MSLIRRLISRSDGPGAAESTSVRRIAKELADLDEPTAHFLASFAFILARVAAADLEIDSEEEATIERILRSLDVVDENHVRLVAEIARAQARDEGGTENYLATREFRDHSDREQRIRLLKALLQVARADGHVSDIETEEIVRIADELDFDPDEIKALRSDLRQG